MRKKPLPVAVPPHSTFRGWQWLRLLLGYILQMVLILLTSLNCYMPTLHLVHYTLLLTPACWKSNNTNARLMAFAPSLTLDPTFGIHSRKTLDTAQPCHLLNLKPNWKPSSSHSIYAPTNINTQFLLQSVCVCVCVCVHMSMCACMCMCVCGGGGGGIFPYGALCVFWWDCALRVYIISYLG